MNHAQRSSAHQCRSCLLIENGCFFWLVMCSLTEYQTFLKGTISCLPIAYLNCYYAQYTINRNAIVHKAAQFLYAFNISCCLCRSIQVQEALSKKRNVEIAAEPRRFGLLNSAVNLCTCLDIASGNCQEVSIYGYSAGEPVCIHRCLSCVL